MNEMCIYISDLRLSHKGKGSERPNATSLLLSIRNIVSELIPKLRFHYISLHLTYSEYRGVPKTS